LYYFFKSLNFCPVVCFLHGLKSTGEILLFDWFFADSFPVCGFYVHSEGFGHLLKEQDISVAKRDIFDFLLVCNLTINRRSSIFEYYPTSRFRASSYFFLVFSMISEGSLGAGGFWFQLMESR